MSWGRFGAKVASTRNEIGFNLLLHIAWMEFLMRKLLRNFGYALRSLRRAPGFTLTAILTLGLGIGATTAIFTLVFDVLLKPLPYPHSDRLVTLEERAAEFRDIYPTLPLNANNFEIWQRNSRTIQAMAAMKQDSLPLGFGGHPLQVNVVLATPGIFRVLEAGPEIGRAFTSDEAQPGRERVVILTNDLWRTQFDSDKGVLGRAITLNGYPYTVIGVMPRSFHLPLVQSLTGQSQEAAKQVEALLPLAFTKEMLQEAVGDFNYMGLGRLRPGVSAAQAAAEIDGLQRSISANLPADEKTTLSSAITPFQQALIGNNRTPLLILLAAVAGLLLVGCVNIANLLLARAAGRRQQMAVAAALGASRGELLAIALRETGLLALFGGAVGIGLAAVLVPALQAYLPPALDFRGPLHLDWAGAGCAVLLAAASTLLAGAVPAWTASRTQPHEALSGEGKLASEPRASKRMRRVLVVVEVAVSVSLVLTTGLLIASLARLMRIDRGFDAERTITVSVNLPRQSYSTLPLRAAFYREVLESLRQLPGVEQAGLTGELPLGGDSWIDMIRVHGDSRPFFQLPTEHFRWISPEYLEAIHLSLAAGRPLRASDEGKLSALVSETTAKMLWPGRDPIGQQFNRGGPGTEPFTVIGVVKDARTISLAATDPMIVYVPYWYRCENGGKLVVRTRQQPGAMADAVRKAIWGINADVSVPEVRGLGVIVADSLANRRFEMGLLLVFAVSAMLLAGLGVYGVVTYSVVQRQREIGLRLALGAQRAGIYGMILREGLAPVATGTVAGLAIAFAFSRLAASLLFEVSPYNPAIAGAAVGVLLAVGAVACLLPARKAAAADPMRALRTG